MSEVLTPDMKKLLEKHSDVVAAIQARTNEIVAAHKEAGRDPLKQDDFQTAIADELKKYEEMQEAKSAQKQVDKARKLRQNSEFNLVDKAYDYREQAYAVGSEGDNPDPDTFAGKMMMTEAQLKEFHTPSEVAQIREVQKLSDRAYLMGKIMSYANDNPLMVNIWKSKSFQQLQGRLTRDADLAKAINVGTTAEGLELVPTALSGRILERVDLGSNMLNWFENIPMPTNPFKMPTDTGDASVFAVTETTADNPTSGDYVGATTPATGNFTFTAVGVGARTRVSYRATEDTIIQILPYIETKLVNGLVDGVEDMILNGDDSGTHMDTDTTASTDPRKLSDGLRYYGLNASGSGVDFGNAAPTLALMRSMLLEADKYAAFPNDGVWVVGAKTYTQLRINDDIKVITLDQHPNPTLLTGQLASWFGVPIQTSKKAREDLAEDGMYDGTTTNRGSILFVHRPGFKVGIRGSVLVETDRDIQAQQTILVASRWLNFKSPWDPTAAAYPFATIGYNIALT